MRRALIVGIDDYPTAPLSGCVNDANKIYEVISRNQDGSPNFDCKVILSPPEQVTRAILRKNIEQLFAHEADAAILYFSGHGTENNLGGYLVTQDAKRYDEGVSMRDVLTLANKSKVKEVTIILDCCHSGALGQIPDIDNDKAMIREGISILSATRAAQAALEVDESGVFTSLVHAALDGGAADVCGNVTVASVYAYVDQALGAWDQRPLFKSHVSRLIPIRKCSPEIELSVLRMLPKYFPDPNYEFPLDPSYEPDANPKNPDHEQIFSHLQKMRASRLLMPIGEEHMYYAAIHSRSCKLTHLGKYYWSLANGGKL